MAEDKFRGGKWRSLQFDGLAQLCELFPYIAYPAYHTQEPDPVLSLRSFGICDMYRKILLGKTFWERLDYERIKYQTVVRTKRVRMPFTKKKIEVKLPGRCTMQELLEYSRRNTAVQGGKRVTSQDAGEAESALAKDCERDLQIQRSPILILALTGVDVCGESNMIRNPRCMYYIPQEGGKNIQKQKGHRSELDVGEQDVESDDGAEMDQGGSDTGGGVITGAPNNAEHMLAIVTAMQMKQNEKTVVDDLDDDDDYEGSDSDVLSDCALGERNRFKSLSWSCHIDLPALFPGHAETSLQRLREFRSSAPCPIRDTMARSLLLPVLLLASAFIGALHFFTPAFVGVPSQAPRASSSRVVAYADDPLDFVASTGKRMEANSENEQLVDLDGLWAIFFLVAGIGATALFMNLLQGLRPS
eukprot:s3522_g3.t1